MAGPRKNCDVNRTLLVHYTHYTCVQSISTSSEHRARHIHGCVKMILACGSCWPAFDADMLQVNALQEKLVMHYVCTSYTDMAQAVQPSVMT